MKRKPIPYNPNLKHLARQLRKRSTLSEVLLWNHLKGRQMMGYDFHRQKPIGNYIVDFFCRDLMLAIEIDGSSHAVQGASERDHQRQRQLESMGISFLRFDDVLVKQDIRRVLGVIEYWIEAYEQEGSSQNDHC